MESLFVSKSHLLLLSVGEVFLHGILSSPENKPPQILNQMNVLEYCRLIKLKETHQKFIADQVRVRPDIIEIQTGGIALPCCV